MCCACLYYLAALLLIGPTRPVVSQIDVLAIYKSMSTTVALARDNFFSGYNPYLSGEEVLNFACAKPSDKIFNPVYFDDPNMATKLDLTKPIGFITHGWTEDGYTKWMHELSEAWVENHETNVCRIDWGIYAKVQYTVAANRNVKLVGGHLARFITGLHDVHGIVYNDVTLVGHSLGGQICGVTGYIFGGQIGRIIAMDPGGPLFTSPISVPLTEQLDPSDAQFVTVIHSNNFVLGVGYSIGHADYYPNGRVTIQPGCVFPFLVRIYPYDTEPNLCSHFRSIKLLELTMANDPHCLAIKCDTYGDYLARRCTNTTDTWGINSAKIEGDFYFWSGADPKCMNKYWPF